MGVGLVTGVKTSCEHNPGTLCPHAYDTVNWVIFHLAVCVFTSISVFAVNVQYWQDKHPYMLLCIRLM